MKIRYIIILLSICFFCNSAMGTPSFPSEGNALSMGIELFHAGRFQEAYEKLLVAFDQSPENMDLNFYLGRCAFEIGDYEMAIMAFERILIASPDTPRVKLEMARAFQKLGANDIARQYYNEVLSTNPPESVKYNIRRFLTFIDASERKHFLNGQIVIGVDWNDNVWASPSIDSIKTIIGDIALSGASSQKTRDWIYNGFLKLQHAYRFSNSRYSWKTEGQFYQALYDKTSPLDLRYVFCFTGSEYFFEKGRMDFGIFLDRIELGESQYQRTKGLKTTWDHALRPNFIVSTALTVSAKDFPGSPEKDSDNVRACVDTHFKNHNNWYGIGFGAERENADDDEYSYHRLESTLSVLRELPFDLTGSAAYEYEYSRYDEPGALFTEKREDHKHCARVGLKKKLWQSRVKNQFLYLAVNYQHTRAYSNIDLYEYDKNLFQSNLTYEF